MRWLLNLLRFPRPCHTCGTRTLARCPACHVPLCRGEMACLCSRTYVTRLSGALVHREVDPALPGLTVCGREYRASEARFHSTVPDGVPQCPACENPERLLAAVALTEYAAAAATADGDPISSVVRGMWDATRQATPEHIQRADADRLIPWIRARQIRLSVDIGSLRRQEVWLAERVEQTLGEDRKDASWKLMHLRAELTQVEASLAAEERAYRAYAPHASAAIRAHYAAS